MEWGVWPKEQFPGRNYSHMLWATVPILFGCFDIIGIVLNTRSGGNHFKKYITCFCKGKKKDFARAVLMWFLYLESIFLAIIVFKKESGSTINQNGELGS